MTRLALPAAMSALVLGEGGLALAEVPVPAPRRGEVLVRMHAAPINPNDLLFLDDDYEVKKPRPVVAGFEGSGTVVASGGGVIGRFLVGRRVACAAGDGGGSWAEYMVAPAMNCAPVRARVDNDQAATLLTNPITAWVLLETARRHGHRAFVQTAAGGALGRMLSRLCRRFGLPMIDVVRRADQAEALRAGGAEHVLVSTAAGFDDELRARCVRLGARFAFDAVAGDTTGRLVRALGDGGHVLVYGFLSGAPCQVDARELVFRHATITGFTLYHWLEQTGTLGKLRAVRAVQRHLADALRTDVRERIPLREFVHALELARGGTSDGKILLIAG